MPRSWAWVSPEATSAPIRKSIVSGSRPVPVDQILEVAARDVLHDDIGDPAPIELVLARVEDPDDVGVGEPGGGPPLALESQTDLRVFGDPVPRS